MTQQAHNVFKHFYDVLSPHLAQQGVTDLFINHPNSVFLETLEGQQQIQDVRINHQWIDDFAKVVAATTKKSNRLPLISTTLPNGERIEIIQPPAVKQACMAIRKPTQSIFSLDELNQQGIFNRADINPCFEDKTQAVFNQQQLNDLPIADILKKAVTEKLNIVISGATGSAKTTLSKALIAFIPAHERLITIEDAEELKTPSHPNAVHLFYPREKNKDALISANTLLLSCLRFKPDRILLAEVRGEEAYEFLDSVNTGHPGSITTIHATSAHSAVDRFVQMVRRSPVGQGLSREDVRETVIEQVDLIIHMENRRVKTLYFPRMKNPVMTPHG